MTFDNLYNKIVLFGDSITQMAFDPALSGYASSLANAYIRKLDVVNRGFSGYNTDWALPILPQILPKRQDQSPNASNIKLMTIFFGANDAALPGSYQHVPIERYIANTKYMINAVKDPESEFYNPEIRLILITPPPVCEELWKKRCDEIGEPLNRTNEHVHKYAEAIKKLGKEMDICVVDIWSGIMDATEAAGTFLSHYLSDGLHLNANGYEVLYTLLMKTIITSYPDIQPDALQYELPYWRFINKENFQNQLACPEWKKKNK